MTNRTPDLTGSFEVLDDDGVVIDTEEFAAYTVESAADLEALFAEFGLATE